MRNGVWMGFSVELALRFGAYMGKAVEFSDVEFGRLIPYIAEKNADISLANMVITEERARLVLFTEPFCNEQHGILTMVR
jgi:polar amino acid transport system substrate-binding protein